MTLSLEYEPAALNLATAPSAAVNCATHIGTRTDIRPLFSATTLMVRAVPPVTQPPQINPIVIAATAPKAIPWRKRVRDSPCKMAGILMTVSFVAHRSAFAAADAAGIRAWWKYPACEIAPTDGAPA